MLSELVLDSEALNRVLDGRAPSRDEITDILEGDAGELLRAARALRDMHHGRTVTFSKKAFFNLTNLCRDTCTYCTYKSEPAEASAVLMDRRDVDGLIGLARRHRCVEALFVTGERPEEQYPQARAWLRKNGFSSTAEYIAHCSEAALSAGLFPHTNAGNLTRGEMRELQSTNASMGLMLESSSERLTELGMPHHLAPSKAPAERLGVLETAGRLGIPMTTGLLVGIGETAQETVDSLLAIRDVHDRFGNIQEIIIQNFQPKPDTAMRYCAPPRKDYFESMVAISRVIMPNMNIQIPPNLSPGSYGDLLSAGINDWGGVSPLTIDHVNPEFGWPQIGRMERHCREAGYDLKCRFPVYPAFIGSLGADLRSRIGAVSDADGYVSEDYWR